MGQFLVIMAVVCDGQIMGISIWSNLTVFGKKIKIINPQQVKHFQPQKKSMLIGPPLVTRKNFIVFEFPQNKLSVNSCVIPGNVFQTDSHCHIVRGAQIVFYRSENYQGSKIIN